MRSNRPAEKSTLVNPTTGARRAARRHWAWVASGASTPTDVAVAVDRTVVQLRAGLSRWIGLPGYLTLMDRALRATITDHPALRNLSFDGGDEKATMLAVSQYGAAEVEAATVELVATVIELLGRLIGDEMALRLVEHWGDRARADVVGTDTEEALDG